MRASYGGTLECGGLTPLSFFSTTTKKESGAKPPHSKVPPPTIDDIPHQGADVMHKIDWMYHRKS
jgi:hypothetical protein